MVLYWIGYKGGEVLLLKRMSRAKFERIRSYFDRHEFWALMVPSMIPPPFPFKLFVLTASAFEMRFWHFLLAIFVGRLIRFLVLTMLVLRFGPQAIAFGSNLVAKHWITLTAAAAALTLVGVYAWARLSMRRQH